MTVAVEDGDLPRTIPMLASRFRQVVPDLSLSFSRRAYCRSIARTGIRIDVIRLAALRAGCNSPCREGSVGGGTRDRPRDLADAEAIVRRRVKELDRDYLEPRIVELAGALEKDDIIERWRNWTTG